MVSLWLEIILPTLTYLGIGGSYYTRSLFKLSYNRTADTAEIGSSPSKSQSVDKKCEDAFFAHSARQQCKSLWHSRRGEFSKKGYKENYPTEWVNWVNTWKNDDGQKLSDIVISPNTITTKDVLSTLYKSLIWPATIPTQMAIAAGHNKAVNEITTEKARKEFMQSGGVLDVDGWEIKRADGNEWWTSKNCANQVHWPIIAANGMPYEGTVVIVECDDCGKRGRKVAVIANVDELPPLNPDEEKLTIQAGDEKICEHKFTELVSDNEGEVYALTCECRKFAQGFSEPPPLVHTLPLSSKQLKAKWAIQKQARTGKSTAKLTTGSTAEEMKAIGRLSHSQPVTKYYTQIIDPDTQKLLGWVKANSNSNYGGYDMVSYDTNHTYTLIKDGEGNILKIHSLKSNKDGGYIFTYVDMFNLL